MRFSFYLPCYWPDLSYPAARMYDDAVAQGQLAEDLGFDSLCIPEHHFINYLTHPQPLLTAVKVACKTRAIRIITSVLVLPLYDVRRLAGEICQADCLTDGRIELGVGRGAFRYEMDRFNIPVEETRDRFDDSLKLLEALLTGEETGWDSPFYKFDPVAITPHPVQKPIPLWIAALTYPAIYHSAKRGYHIQTTPLRGGMDTVRMQAGAFNDAVRDAGGSLNHLKFSMLRMLYVARDRADAREKIAIAYENHRRFSNVFDTPGQVKDGAIVPIDVPETLEEVADALLIGTADEIVEKLAVYEELKVQDLLLNMSFGASHADVMASMERFATKVMPAHLTQPRAAA
ncbi:MAG: LLM class flavin-dependent oxidoreductase [Proteobacteria bacterium]|nr:LLM class flavin-dependent oxidoreductase [Pseudomonadota bacterium]MDA1070143.1 LLM class flavin-dependent oxidoreductase [Pseudomonadota bacterium]